MGIVALALLAASCEKSNDAIVREQLEEARNACAAGCLEQLPGCAIKGNISQAGRKFYHLPGRQSYPGIIIQPERGERWFCTEAEAVANGWMPSQVP